MKGPSLRGLALGGGLSLRVLDTCIRPEQATELSETSATHERFNYYVVSLKPRAMASA